jgi:hypothetical protein
MGLLARLTPQCVRNEIFATFKRLESVPYVDKSQQSGNPCGWRFLKTPDEVQHYYLGAGCRMPGFG